MIPITNSAAILQFLCDNPILFKSHNEKYALLFGKPKRFHIFNMYRNRFSVNYNGMNYHIYSKKGKGTSIEIDASSYEDVNSGKYDTIIKEFCNYLIKALE